MLFSMEKFIGNLQTKKNNDKGGIGVDFFSALFFIVVPPIIAFLINTARAYWKSGINESATHFISSKGTHVLFDWPGLLAGVITLLMAFFPLLIVGVVVAMVVWFILWRSLPP